MIYLIPSGHVLNQQLFGSILESHEIKSSDPWLSDVQYSCYNLTLQC